MLTLKLIQIIAIISRFLNDETFNLFVCVNTRLYRWDISVDLLVFLLDIVLNNYKLKKLKLHKPNHK